MIANALMTGEIAWHRSYVNGVDKRQVSLVLL